ncbi:methyltransferase [Yinghuangia sp. YIM S09857]|uniref:methyltransferase n=1 Tax=Yinghuangia sp. YIM S09857 TaxID=3436929 RepID=UPI003F52B168
MTTPTTTAPTQQPNQPLLGQRRHDSANASDDPARLRAAVEFVRHQDTTGLLSLLLPGLDGFELRALVDRCRFAHAGLVLFPPDLPALQAELAEHGLEAAAAPQPSVVVRDRLAARHRRDAADLDVGILRPAVRGPEGERRSVEVFVLAVPPGSDLADIAAHERTRDHEAHLAFEVDRPDPLVLRGLWSMFVRHGAVADGGGYNPHEDGTVFYFAAPADSKAGYRRLEMYARGDHRQVLAAHLEDHRARQPAETLLRLLTGAWTTQALAACAQLRLCDALDDHTATAVPALAREVDAHPQNLATLLRYLVMLGVAEEEPDGYRLTALGALLRADTPGSMRPLALMYGGPFYQSFALLTEAVRTGVTGFEHLFGENHFDYFVRHPELAVRFDQSMAASACMFDPLPLHPVIAAADAAPEPRTVVDVAGGTGELLERLLAARPNLRGVLLERPHVADAARRAFEASGLDARCDFRTGDFADVPAGGDVYVLSRVLHDWDDERCEEILRHCAAAMPPDADLLVVERLLPADGSPSLATAWDLHMMCNVGGRERRADHYARLLAGAGLSLVDAFPARTRRQRPARPQDRGRRADRSTSRWAGRPAVEPTADQQPEPRRVRTSIGTRWPTDPKRRCVAGPRVAGWRSCSGPSATARPTSSPRCSTGTPRWSRQRASPRRRRTPGSSHSAWPSRRATTPSPAC